MSIDIAPGTQVTVKIIKRPTSQAAAKTLLRVAAKHPKAVLDALKAA